MYKMETLSKGYWIMPNTVLYDKELSATQKLVYVIVSSLCAEKWHCRASNKYIWELLNLSVDTTSEAINKLVEKKYLHSKIDKKDGNKRILTLSEKSPIPIGKNSDTYPKKSEDIITRDNIWDNKLSHSEDFDVLYDNYYWLKKWADRNKCDKLIRQLLDKWIPKDEILDDEILYKAECQLRWEWRYVKKFETWLKEYNQQTKEQKNNEIKEILSMYYKAKQSDDKFIKSARNPRNMLCERFGEENIFRISTEVKPKKKINFVFT